MLIYTLQTVAQTKLSYHAERLPHEFLSLDVHDFPAESNAAEIADFTISPDHSRIAVAFVTVENGRTGTGLAQWEVNNKKLLGWHTLPTEIAIFVSIDHNTIQYTPDGSQIIFQSASDLYSLDAVTLKTLYSIHIPENTKSASERGHRRFVLSRDGTVLALFSEQSLFPERLGALRLYATRTGTKLAEWPLSVSIQSLSLSPNGKNLLVGLLNPRDETDLLLLDAQTGKTIRHFESGYGLHKSLGALLPIQFLNEDHFIVVPSLAINASSHDRVQSIKVFDIHTGKAVRELTYDKLAAVTDVWTSDVRDTVTVLNLWESYWRRHFTEGGIPSVATLLFFKDSDASPYCVLGPLDRKRVKPIQTGFIRFSPDLSIVGLYESRKIDLFKTGQCDSSSKK